MYLQAIGAPACPSDAPLHFAVCHTACSSSSCVRAAPVSFTSLHSITPPFVALHHVRRPPLLQRHGMFYSHTKAIHKHAHTFSATTAAGSLGSITLTASLFHFSQVQSTRCLSLLCSPRRPARLQPVRICTAHSSLISPASAKPPLHSSATSVPGGNILRWPPMGLPTVLPCHHTKPYPWQRFTV